MKILSITEEIFCLCISTMSFSTGVFIMMMYCENSQCSMALTLILPPHQSHVGVTPPYALSNLGIMLMTQNNILNSNIIFITELHDYMENIFRCLYLFGVQKMGIVFISQWTFQSELENTAASSLNDQHMQSCRRLSNSILR